MLVQRGKELGLSEEQEVKVMEVRRKGRNNMHATKCRQRKADQSADLQVIELSQSQPDKNIKINYFQRNVEAQQQRNGNCRKENARKAQELKGAYEELHHLELRVELEDYLPRQQ